MKIIKDSTLKQHTCRRCSSILEVSGKDLHHSYMEYDGALRDEIFFYCPCCGFINLVN